jgi:hypothetical protein
MTQYSTPTLAIVEDPIKSRHDIKTTRESIKTLLAGGTPDWISHPSDYRAFVKESFQAEKEISDSMVTQYKMQGQELLTDAAPRKVNILRSQDFVQKLKDNGVKCFVVYNGMPQTMGLWACPPFIDEMKYIAYIQIPAMYEWSVLKLDKHNLPAGESFRGWRTVVAQLILKEILTEAKAHEIYGRPAEGTVSKMYRHTLFNFRNGIGRQEAEPAL